MKGSNYKKLSAILIAAAMMSQGTAVMAADFVDGGLFTAPAVVKSVTAPQKKAAPQVVEIEAEDIDEDVEELPAEDAVLEIEETIEEAIEETVEAIEEAVEVIEEAAEEIPVVEEAPAVTLPMVEEIPVYAEIPEAEEAPAEEAPVEYKTDFYYEDEEVVILAAATLEAQIPMNAEMVVRKLAEGTEEYEALKAVSAASIGSDESAEYAFYDVTFAADGVQLDPADDTVSIQIQFKTLQMSETAEHQNVLHIGETGVKDVTAPAAAGSNVSSVRFAL